jgi:uncharacterized membrane protein
MNIRFQWRGWLTPALAVFFVTCTAMYFFIAHPQGFAKDEAAVATITRPVDYAEAHTVIEKRCTPCHATHPTRPEFPQPPNGFVLETPEQVIRNADKIRLRAVSLKNMPLANMTNMTPEEREILRAWIDQGAKGP